MLGQEVMTAHNYNITGSIDITNLPGGMYTVIISNSTGARKLLQLVVSK